MHVSVRHAWAEKKCSTDSGPWPTASKHGQEAGRRRAHDLEIGQSSCPKESEQNTIVWLRKWQIPWRTHFLALLWPISAKTAVKRESEKRHLKWFSRSLGDGFKHLFWQKQSRLSPVHEWAGKEEPLGRRACYGSDVSLGEREGQSFPWIRSHFFQATKPYVHPYVRLKRCGKWGTTDRLIGRKLARSPRFHRE